MLYSSILQCKFVFELLTLFNQMWCFKRMMVLKTMTKHIENQPTTTAVSLPCLDEAHRYQVGFFGRWRTLGERSTQVPPLSSLWFDVGTESLFTKTTFLIELTVSCFSWSYWLSNSIAWAQWRPDAPPINKLVTFCKPSVSEKHAGKTRGESKLKIVSEPLQ